MITFYGVLWAEGANDLLAQHFDIPLYITTRIAQVTMFVGPVIAYILTKRICLGLQRKDAHLLEHGVETGIIRQLPNGEYIEVTRPVSEEKRAVLAFRSKPPGLPSSGERTRTASRPRRCAARWARSGPGSTTSSPRARSWSRRTATVTGTGTGKITPRPR